MWLPTLPGKEGDTQRTGQAQEGRAWQLCRGHSAGDTAPGVAEQGPSPWALQCSHSQPSKGLSCIPTSQAGPQTTRQNNSVVR